MIPSPKDARHYHRDDVLGILKALLENGVDPRDGTTELTDEYLADQIGIDPVTFTMWRTKQLPNDSRKSQEASVAFVRWAARVKRDLRNEGTGSRYAPVPIQITAPTYRMALAEPVVSRELLATLNSPYELDYVFRLMRGYFRIQNDHRSAGDVFLMLRKPADRLGRATLVLRYNNELAPGRNDSSRAENLTEDLERVATFFTLHARATINGASRLLRGWHVQRGDEYEFSCTIKEASLAIAKAVEISAQLAYP